MKHLKELSEMFVASLMVTLVAVLGAIIVYFLYQL
jgi:hypothetical protein